MRQFFFLFFLLAALTTVNAQKRVYDFGILENNIYAKSLVMGDLVFYASPKKIVEVDDKVSAYASGQYTKRVKFKGRGEANGCNLIVNVKTGTRVTVFAANANKNAGPKSLHVTSTVVTDYIQKDFIVSDGKSLAKATYTHTGAPGKVIFIAPDACFNFYRIEVEDPE